VNVRAGTLFDSFLNIQWNSEDATNEEWECGCFEQHVVELHSNVYLREADIIMLMGGV
jgi:hypothetical protein